MAAHCTSESANHNRAQISDAGKMSCSRMATPSVVKGRIILGSPVVQDSGQVGKKLLGRQAGSIILYEVLCGQLVEQRENVLEVR